jgi:hypothetical protein
MTATIFTISEEGKFLRVISTPISSTSFKIKWIKRLNPWFIN